MTRPYNNTGKLVDYYVNKFMSEDPTLHPDQAYQKYKDMMRERGSNGGKKSTSRPFADVPGLAQKVATKEYRESLKK